MEKVIHIIRTLGVSLVAELEQLEMISILTFVLINDSVSRAFRKFGIAWNVFI